MVRRLCRPLVEMLPLLVRTRSGLLFLLYWWMLLVLALFPSQLVRFPEVVRVLPCKWVRLSLMLVRPFCGGRAWCW